MRVLLCKTALRLLLIVIASFAWAQNPVGCEISNTGADSGTATISTLAGASAPGGIGAVGFRIPVACQTTNVAYHVAQEDHAIQPSNVYDIGLYCVSGDCCGTNNNLCNPYPRLYVHTGLIYGPWLTDDRNDPQGSNVYSSETVAFFSYQNNVTTVTISAGNGQGQLWPADFPVYDSGSLSNCSVGAFNGKNYSVTSVTLNGQTLTVYAQIPGSLPQQSASCTVTTGSVYPPGFNTPTQDCDADQNSIAYQCEGALRWVVDPSGVQTVCTALPCSLPAGLYAAAIGTNCSQNCAALFGDEDKGLIYPFTASASFPAGGLPANMSGFTWSNGPVWNTDPVQGALTPIKPPKLLIY